MVNSRLGLFSAAISSSGGTPLHQLWPSFSRSYGCNLPSSLTRVFPRTLGFSPRLPVSVLVRVYIISLEAFLGSVVQLNSARVSPCLSISSRPFDVRFCLHISLPPSTHSSIRVLSLLTASLHPSCDYTKYWNFCQLSIAYAFCLGLGPDLPWDDERCPGTLRLSVDKILTYLFATHTGILTS